ncbi:uncharacterized protein BCR38DRAFT_453897 [Pseudomassariella vexata]|uniref:Uncharacterized protein n=1 Tax=Pseudomassariella vexata TaxID=1141098 RepID=A0A1Y2EIQ8_9PEZI|nr:uncharacterized protein BCR38DRAFT_453897 [Pseudomassariella vexata]ORY71327.1 hypothetical protein BCR38DRAFT_453897 [Pseudomassariella vexata]
MPTSLDSARPIMAPSVASPRTSVRYSTYSMAPSLTATVQTTDSAQAEIRDIESGLARMENKALSEQRVELSEEKTANMSKLALGAKLDRALDRRMSGQDAVMRPRKRENLGPQQPPAAVLSEKVKA